MIEIPQTTDWNDWVLAYRRAMGWYLSMTQPDYLGIPWCREMADAALGPAWFCRKWDDRGFQNVGREAARLGAIPWKPEEPDALAGLEPDAPISGIVSTLTGGPILRSAPVVKKKDTVTHHADQLSFF
ncbi:hypothetical protein A4U49_09525 [Acidithiobacillus ferrivorans]|jgi:hypothetical protein|uniref:hypothetical protein n=1 Tax=Acidithiobacillus ferrivorans TaxID=160808 RepID=UPI000893DF85|nr:hypothetical protein [Acidithiobacillus ferrivorans]OFA15993.1 hypothetical protein A4U49_09525 [Acidithiobacillus ferrivorans]